MELIDNPEDVVVILEGVLDDLNPADDFIGTVFDKSFGKTGVGKSRTSKSGGKHKMTIRKRVKRMSKTQNRK